LGLDDCKEGIFKGVDRYFLEEELTFYMGEDDFQELNNEYKSYLEVG